MQPVNTLQTSAGYIKDGMPSSVENNSIRIVPVKKKIRILHETDNTAAKQARMERADVGQKW